MARPRHSPKSSSNREFASTTPNSRSMTAIALGTRSKSRSRMKDSSALLEVMTERGQAIGSQNLAVVGPCGVEGLHLPAVAARALPELGLVQASVLRALLVAPDAHLVQDGHVAGRLAQERWMLGLDGRVRWNHPLVAVEAGRGVGLVLELVVGVAGGAPLPRPEPRLVQAVVEGVGRLVHVTVATRAARRPLTGEDEVVAARARGVAALTLDVLLVVEEDRRLRGAGPVDDDPVAVPGRRHGLGRAPQVREDAAGQQGHRDAGADHAHERVAREAARVGIGMGD